LELVRYIHLNPIRAKVVTDAESYLWTSHLSYLGKGNQELVEADFALEQLGRNRTVGKRRYREIILEEIGNGKRHCGAFSEEPEEKKPGDY